MNVFMLVFDLVMDLLVLESEGKFSRVILGGSGVSGGKASKPIVAWAIIRGCPNTQGNSHYTKDINLPTQIQTYANKNEPTQ